MELENPGKSTKLLDKSNNYHEESYKTGCIAGWNDKRDSVDTVTNKRDEKSKKIVR